MSLGRHQDAAVTSPCLGEMFGWFLSSWGRQKLLGLELPKWLLCCKENTALGAVWWKEIEILAVWPQRQVSWLRARCPVAVYASGPVIPEAAPGEVHPDLPLRQTLAFYCLWSPQSWKPNYKTAASGASWGKPTSKTGGVGSDLDAVLLTCSMPSLHCPVGPSIPGVAPCSLGLGPPRSPPCCVAANTSKALPCTSACDAVVPWWIAASFVKWNWISNVLRLRDILLTCL